MVINIDLGKNFKSLSKSPIVLLTLFSNYIIELFVKY